MVEILHVLARNSNGSFGISNCFGPGLSLLLEQFPPSILQRLEREREREREKETVVKEQRKVKVERVLLPRLQ